MLITARTYQELPFFLGFMARNGITVPMSEDIRVIGRVNTVGDLMGVVLYADFNGRTCSMHCAGCGNWVNREFLRAAFEYPFVTNDMVQIFGPVPANNARALKFNKHLGFEVLHRIRYGWDRATDLVVMGMNRATCRWINEVKHGKVVDTAAPGLRGSRPAASSVQQRADNDSELGESAGPVHSVG